MHAFNTLMILRTYIPCWILNTWLVGAVSGVYAQSEIIVKNDLTYRKVNNEELQLDVAYPEKPQSLRPGLILIHGGGWSGGQRQSFRGLMEKAAQRGYVAATVSYRLTSPQPDTGLGKTPFPAQIHDCKAAVRWLKQHASEFNLDVERLGVLGGSAGGHLALLVGLTDPQDMLEEEGADVQISSRVAAVVNIFGPTDLKRCYETSLGGGVFLKALCQGAPQDSPELYRKASPVYYATADDPPVLTIHGTRDTLVPAEQAELLDQAMKAVGAPHELLLLEGQGHGFQGEAAQRAEEAIWQFLAKRLRP